MDIYPKIIRDSISADLVRITTMEVTLHRFVHAELMTHRAFSRNSASSRAVPIHKFLASVYDTPAMPFEWGSNKGGMQAGPPLDGDAALLVEALWLEARDRAAVIVEMLNVVGLHKQLANRLIEPFLWHKVIITSTDWENFFKLRCHPDAQPEIRQLAENMREVYNSHQPSIVAPRHWHTPYILPEEESLPLMVKVKVSAARCARVSYLTHDGRRDISKDLELYDKLVDGDHDSPLEHVATPLTNLMPVSAKGNFYGWGQARHNLELIKGMSK